MAVAPSPSARQQQAVSPAAATLVAQAQSALRLLRPVEYGEVLNPG